VNCLRIPLPALTRNQLGHTWTRWKRRGVANAGKKFVLWPRQLAVDVDLSAAMEVDIFYWKKQKRQYLVRTEISKSNRTDLCFRPTYFMPTLHAEILLHV
jgi:hypothetical protein